MAGLQTRIHIFINNMKEAQPRQKFISATRYKNTYCTVLWIFHIFSYIIRVSCVLAAIDFFFSRSTNDRRNCSNCKEKRGRITRMIGSREAKTLADDNFKMSRWIY